MNFCRADCKSEEKSFVRSHQGPVSHEKFFRVIDLGLRGEWNLEPGIVQVFPRQACIRCSNSKREKGSSYWMLISDKSDSELRTQTETGWQRDRGTEKSGKHDILYLSVNDWTLGFWEKMTLLSKVALQCEQQERLYASTHPQKCVRKLLDPLTE